MSKLNLIPNLFSKQAIGRNVKYDVGIVGGGVAGAVAAVALRKLGIRVALIEQTKSSNCSVGEYVSARGKSLLAQIGLEVIFNHARHRRCSIVKSSWGTDTLHVKHGLQDPWGDSYILDRTFFDQQLLNSVLDHGAQLLQGRYRSARQRNGCWSVEFEDSGFQKSLDCDFLIDASGRSAAVARSLGVRLIRAGRLVAVVGLVQCGDLGIETNSVLIESSVNGWFYSTPIDSGSCITNFYTCPETIQNHAGPLSEMLIKHIEDSKFTAKRLSIHSATVQQTKVRAAHPQRLEQPVGDGWLAIGDAAACFDPIAAEGICNAIESGINAALVYASVCAGEMEAMRWFSNKTENEFRRHLLFRKQLYEEERRWSESPFGNCLFESPDIQDGGQKSSRGIASNSAKHRRSAEFVVQ